MTRQVVHRIEDGMDRQGVLPGLCSLVSEPSLPASARVEAPVPSLGPAPSTWAAWFSVDGEGSIGCHAFAARRDRGRTIVFRAQLTQRADERPLLDEIQHHLGGSVYTHASGAQWVLSGVPALLGTLAPLFDSYPLRTKKAREWQLVLPLLHERAAHPSRYYPDGFYERVAEVSRELSKGRGTWMHLRRTETPRPMKPLGRPPKAQPSS